MVNLFQSIAKRCSVLAIPAHFLMLRNYDFFQRIFWLQLFPLLRVKAVGIYRVDARDQDMRFYVSR